MLREIIGKRRLPRLGQSENKAVRGRLYINPATGGTSRPGFRDYVGPIPRLPGDLQGRVRLPYPKHPVPSERLLAGKERHDLMLSQRKRVPYGGPLSRALAARRRGQFR